MRIGIDCRLWNESGVGRYTRNLVRELIVLDKENDYILFTLSSDGKEILKQVQNDNSDNFQVVKADIRWHSIEEQINFPLILKNHNLDLVHFPYFSVPIFYNKPFVITIHDLILHNFPTGQASTLPLLFYKAKLLGYKIAISRASKNAKKIIVPTNAVKKDVLKYLKVSEDKIVVTYEGTNENSKLKIQPLRRFPSASLKASAPQGRNSKLQFKNKNYFLYVGNAYPHKNLERLVQAFKEFKENYENKSIILVLVGKEDYFYKRLKERVKDMSLEGSIIFRGEVSDLELSSLYKNAKALVVPSLMEGFGLPALEAMSNKCLVLASDIPALKEVCLDAAVYFDPYDVENLAKEMQKIYSKNEDYEKKILKGLERSKIFSWKNMASETLKIYNKAVT